MSIDRAYFEGVILACKKEQDILRMNHAKQDAVIAFCEMTLRGLQEEKKMGEIVSAKEGE